MSITSAESIQRRPSGWLSVLIFLLATGSMFYLRLVLFGDRYITLTYGLALLICLWHRDRRLLWAMAAAFISMSSYKAFFLVKGTHGTWDIVQWLMQLANTVIMASVVHIVLNLNRSIEQRNAELEQANEELAARDEEISNQNEELQVQTEELAQQNEELQQQSEELQQQSEELHAQTSELQAINNELQQRESVLQTLLESLRHTGGNEDELLTGICRSALDLMTGAAAAAAVVEKQNDNLAVRAEAGMNGLLESRLPFAKSFAAVVMEQNRTAYVDDLEARPDIKARHPEGRRFRSVLAAPLRLRGVPVGAVELYAETSRQWTTEHFRIVEWVAAQSSLILEVRQLNEQLAQSNSNLEKLVAERTGRLQELVGELEHFSYSITHDMRAPLRAMQGFAEMLARPEPGGSEQDRTIYLERIMTAAARMDRLITDALSYSRAVRQDLVLEPVDAKKLLKGMIESYPEFQLPSARIEVAEEVPPVLANEAGLTQCFSNLLNNAVKFVEPGQQPQVRVRCDRRDGMVRLWFEDNGIGISQEMTPRLFGMFQRGSRKYEGTGIGLALVRKVTERMGGRVGVESATGKGSRFWIELKAVD
ncbi:MAG TPA: GAF domain-containing sensor histidine kinase [Verrucomicrobiae bacterium]|nr:GAF domain-containing sensor histidine kinase [Verrucomicrobiae bacterium]